MLQSVEPHTGTQWPVCNESPESVKPVGSALWNNPAVIPNQVGFVKLSQIGVFIDSIRGCKTPGCDGNLVPVAVKTIGMVPLSSSSSSSSSLCWRTSPMDLVNLLS